MMRRGSHYRRYFALWRVGHLARGTREFLNRWVAARGTSAGPLLFNLDRAQSAGGYPLPLLIHQLSKPTDQVRGVLEKPT
jgi:hypothetical protein